MSDRGRNDPCPCGGGKKYKRCHLAADVAARSSESGGVWIHDLDRRLSVRMRTFADALFGSQWLPFDPRGANRDVLHIILPISLYHLPVDGKSVARWFVGSEEESLTERERKWLDAQMAAWLSVWEIDSVDSGRSIGLRDLLTGERRDVLERSASKQVVVRHTVLARIVDFEGNSYICGMHPTPLTPLQAADVIDELRMRLHFKNRVAQRRLRASLAVSVLMETWDYALKRLAARARRPKTLTNTEGDPFVLATDRFAVRSGDLDAVRSAIAALPRVEKEDDVTYIFLQGDRTIIASAHVAAGVLKVETNSLRRADSARATIEAACGPLIRFRSRDVVDPLSPKVREAANALPELPPGADAIVREWKREHYSTWPDESLPALGGKTPRQAMRTRRGAERVDALLRDIEHLEATLPAEERFDVAELRAALGLDR